MGELLAIGCALGWSISVILFRKTQDHVHPVAMNLYKNLLAFVLMIQTVLIFEGWDWPAVALGDYSILLISGFLGIGIADLLLIKTIHLLGASRVAVVECLYSPFVISLSFIFLGQGLTPLQLMGTALVLSAIFVVTYQSKAKEVPRRQLVAGLTLGTLALLGMAGGIIMIMPLFDRLPLMWIIEIRLLAGAGASIAIFHFAHQRRQMLRSLFTAQHRGQIFAASFISTYLSMIMWVAGYKYNEASTAAVLNQTSTFFILVLAAIFLKEKLTAHKIIGTVMAAAGALMVSL